jgi:protein SCO1/2
MKLTHKQYQRLAIRLRTAGLQADVHRSSDESRAGNEMPIATHGTKEHSMSSKNWKNAAFISLIIAIFAFVIAAKPLAASGDDSSHFPNVELITQDGKKVHFYDDLIKGKIVAIDLIYTTCRYSCPLETARLAQVQKKLGDRVGKDIFFYSISIDPENDTPEVLRAYMKQFHVGPGWTFLTGKKDDIIFLGKRLGLYTTPSVNADGHIAHLLIGNEAIGQWVRSSALDNPSFQSRMIGNFLDENFKHDNPAKQAGSVDGSPLQNFDKGKYLFGRDCIACHTIGHGDKIGPDLLGVIHVRSRQWLTQIIQHPDQLLDGKDPIATALLTKYSVRMPNIYVGDVDTGYIIRYIEQQTAAQEKQASNGDATKVGNQ